LKKGRLRRELRSLRAKIRSALTKKIWVKDGKRKELRMEEIPPSEMLVLFTQFTIASIATLTALEVAHLLILGAWSNEIFAAITGLIGTITGLFVGARS